ncbi:MAG TPA: hypothetical protein VLB84_10895, partial [Bacteroidia bacterium]|nr:hypothetical protein [Bacteroidia bacterium]
VVIDSTKKLPVKSYGINSKKINPASTVDPVTPAQMVGEPLTKLYNALVKGGFGTYTTPYLEFWYNGLRSKENTYGVHLKHLSSSSTLKNYGYAGMSDDQVGLYGKKFLKEHSLIGNFNFSRNGLHFYGYDANQISLSKKETAQHFNYFGANAELLSHYSKLSRFNHDIKLGFYNVTDAYKSSENNIKANGYVQTTFDKELIKVNALVDYYNFRSPLDTINNTIVALNPNFIADGDKYHASLGITATLDIEGASKFYFHPKVEASYNIFDNIIVPYAGVTGGVKKNSFKSVTDENPFISSGAFLRNSITKFDVYGGLKGTLSSSIAYNVHASYASIANMLFYVNDTTLPENRFKLAYDDVNVLNLHGEVIYQMREKLRVLIGADYYNYKTTYEIRAWYKPQVKLNLAINYNLSDKIIVKADVFYFDNQYAKTYAYADDTTTKKIVAQELKGLFDLNIGAEYRYNKRLGFFLSLNNLANIRYFRYINYPTQRFSIMGGLSYAF